MSDSEILEHSGWLTSVLARFDPSWSPVPTELGLDRSRRGGLLRISRSDVAERLDQVLVYYRAEGPALLRFARSILGSNADLAEDVVQVVMHRASQNPPERLANPSGYFHTAIRNEVITQGQRASREQARQAPGEDAAADVADGGAAFEDRIVFQLTVAKALARLTPREQQLVVRIYVEGMKLKDAADELGIAVGNVKRALFDARERLREDPDMAVFRRDDPVETGDGDGLDGGDGPGADKAGAGDPHR